METVNAAQVKEFAKKKVEELRGELDKWNKVLEAFGDNQVQVNKKEEPGLPSHISRISLAPKVSSKIPIKKMVFNTLMEEQTPLTSRSIMDIINMKYGKKYVFENFSGAFSTAYRKLDLIQYSLENPTKEVKAVYCLKEWVNEDNTLKEEYKSRLQAKYDIY